MAEIVLDLRPRICPEHLDAVRRAAESLPEEDTLEIVVEREDSHQMREIVHILEQAGLGTQPKGGHAHEYRLFASRRLPRPAPRTGPYENR
ncbi:MAG: hypothetical protein IRY95_02190 [Clostridia bacterium]|nr:hypothetical protein [Clostridia bacterium]